VGHNGEAALRVCVPANAVSEFIELLGVKAGSKKVTFDTPDTSRVHQETHSLFWLAFQIHSFLF